MSQSPSTFFSAKGVDLIFSGNVAFRQMIIFLCAICAPVSVPVVLSASVLNPSASAAPPQPEKPDWCKNLPRPDYQSLEQVPLNDPWFEVYKVAPATFAIYEPHQAEEVISYLVVGTKQALLFDTGMGIGNIKAVVARLTSRPVVVLNSHTHDDHVGGNWQFPFIYGMDTTFTRANAKGSRDDAQAEIGKDMLCGALPKNFDSAKYSTKPWHISLFVHDHFKINLGGRTVEIIATPGHTPDSIALIDRANGLLFTGDTYYPGQIWLFRPETDFPAYLDSVKKLSALVPELKVVLGSHNVPVAKPPMLLALDAAIHAVLAAEVQPRSINGNQATYEVGKISFRLRNPLPALNSTPGTK
jgi:glyoxylase-like metal-dependent hydrolase (beta-lactamase superfamily II)